MKRFLCFTLLCLITLPVFAQEEPTAVTRPSLPRDPALLMRLKEQLTFKSREIQRVLALIPNDSHTTEVLEAEQADLVKQLNEITRELQSLRMTSPNITEQLPGTETRLDLPPGAQPVQPNVQGKPDPYVQMPIQNPYQSVPVPNNPYPSLMPETIPMGMGMGVYSGVQGGMPVGYLPATPPSALPFNPANPMTNPYLLEQAQAFETAHWGPRLPRELTEVKQSVDSLQKEISSLKDTIKTLETQIQVLNRIVLLLSGPANERLPERPEPQS